MAAAVVVMAAAATVAVAAAVVSAELQPCSIKPLLVLNRRGFLRIWGAAGVGSEPTAEMQTQINLDPV